MVYTGYDGSAMGGHMPISGEELELKTSSNEVRNLLHYDMLIKHPLEHTWTVWHWENDRSKHWSDMLIEVTSFNTVEDFFTVYYFIKPPSQLSDFNDYMVFKQGVRPMWEDDINKDGGRWIIMLDKNTKAMNDKLWQDLLLCSIGECFQHSNEINGVVINLRKKANKLSLWTKNSANAQAVLYLGQQLKGLLKLTNVEIQYQAHKDAIVQHGSNFNAMYKL
ncbi:eukaryotic translation initiation factor 4E1-like [Drosophila miranda]|uniref:eukaryotic translation initiation factor 4E1-like n=1 Tax=Drosophila miranda TaxID=7229 RepID=UPI0007E810D6|nr:eukaryotic translation initiation factor 4E1-like [Drosophila miranda]XP_033250042.1 eukaryotic translation initiation factor 4E1-like [Drosophila miranda]